MSRPAFRIAAGMVTLALAGVVTAARAEAGEPASSTASPTSSVGSSADPEAFASARSEFERGVRLAKSYPSEAAAAFRRSIELRRSLSAYFNLVLMLRKLGEYGEIGPLLEEHLELARSQHDKESAERNRSLSRQLQADLGRIAVLVRGGGPGAIWLDDKRVASAGAEHVLFVEPQRSYTLEVRREGYEPVRKDVMVPARGELVRLELEAPARPVVSREVAEAPPAPPAADDGARPSAVRRGEEATAASPSGREDAGAPRLALASAVPGPKADLELGVTDLSARPADAETSSAITDHWWFWAAVGVVAAAGIGGGVAYYLSHRSSGCPTGGGTLGVTVCVPQQ